MTNRRNKKFQRYYLGQRGKRIRVKYTANKVVAKNRQSISGEKMNKEDKDGERERERERMCVCVCVCVCESDRDTV